MKLTIGTAVYDDFDGVYFTVQALRMYHADVMKDIEIIVVDNKPDTKGSGYIKNLLESWARPYCAGVKYIPMTSPLGTTQPRNRIFQEASGDAVMCIDSHVLLSPGSLARLIQYYDENPTTRDLLSGPMLYDDFKLGNTHFDDFWRGEMWGIWGKAWEAPSGERFTVINTSNRADYRQLSMGLLPTITPLPQIQFSGHERPLREVGCKLLAEQDKPFAIPGMGLGLFTCRRDAWLGFNPHFRGFGGEEMYIHEKYRQAGAQALCLPWLTWGHRFGRPNGVPYLAILTRWNKIRNYVLGLQELNIPLDRCYAHFVGAKLMTQWEWDSLISDPVGLEKGPTPVAGQPVSSPKEQPPNRPQPRATIENVGELQAWCKTIDRDLNKHIDTLADYAGRSDIAVEVTHRRESTVGLLSAKRVISFQAEVDPLIQRMLDLYSDRLEVNYVEPKDFPDVPACDLLFLDTVHTADRLWKELSTYGPKVGKYIILHDTALYGELGEDKGPGMLPALRRFMKDFPEWSVVFHTKDQYGLTVISRVASEKPKLPSTWTLANNFAKAMTDYAADKFHNVSKEVYEERLGICSMCDQRNENSCSVCGCNLAAKAAGRAFSCPLGKWPESKV